MVFRRNLDRKLVNGLLGNLVKMDSDALGRVDCLHIKFDSIADVVQIRRVSVNFNLTKQTHQTRTQFPIAVSFGATIHKCQGVSCNNVMIKLDAAFSPGMGYDIFYYCSLSI